MSKKKGLLESVVDSVLHPNQAPEGAETATQEEADAMIKSGEAIVTKSTKTPKKMKAPKVPADKPEGLQPPTGPIPGDYVDRSPVKKEKKHPEDYAAGQVDRIGELKTDESDEQK